MDAEEFEQVLLDPGHKVIPQIYVDSAQNYLFAVSIYKVGGHRISPLNPVLTDSVLWHNLIAASLLSNLFSTRDNTDMTLALFYVKAKRR